MKVDNFLKKHGIISLSTIKESSFRLAIIVKYMDGTSETITLTEKQEKEFEELSMKVSDDAIIFALKLTQRFGSKFLKKERKKKLRILSNKKH